MRHGAAEDAAPSRRDADRSLTPAGRVAVRRVALALRDAQVTDIGQIISSPLTRAIETAEIVCSILGPQLEVAIDEDLLPDGSAFDLAVRVASVACDTLLVGHQPNIEMVARALAAPVARGLVRRSARGSEAPPPSVHLPIGFRTASLVGFQVQGRPPPYALTVSLDPSDLPDT